MPMPSVHRRTAAAASAIAVLLFSACSVDSADSSVNVTGTNDSCEIANDILTAGKTDFEFINTAGDVSELYVLRENGDVVDGQPGQTGDGFSSTFTVTGEGGTAQAVADRTIGFEATDFTYPDLELTGITAGQTIRLEMSNRGSQAHEFEVLDADGEALGEVASMGVGAQGGATITFADDGTYTFQCILIDAATEKPHTELGMTGTFVVQPA